MTNDDSSPLWRLGYDEFFQSNLSPATSPEHVARVVTESRGAYVVRGTHGTRHATLSGRLRHLADDATDLPTVGDWIELGPASDDLGIIERILPRRTHLVRRSAGGSGRPQPIAANVDLVLVVGAASARDDARTRKRGINLRRFERYLVLVEQSGARPTIVLNKCDLTPDVEAIARAVRDEVGDVPVVATSALTGEGLAALRSSWTSRETIALVGSSGVGKTALMERLAGEALGPTGDVREADERGRHTTTRRDLHLLPEGGILIDTPGMRELGLWSEGADTDAAFADIRSLAEGCRFRDCRHQGEPGCRVLEALATGTLSAERLESRRKLDREIAHELRRVDSEARRAQKRMLRTRARSLRAKKPAR